MDYYLKVKREKELREIDKRDKANIKGVLERDRERS